MGISSIRVQGADAPYGIPADYKAIALKSPQNDANKFVSK
jgi:hypothetical protein